jgi:hypothetical protein
VARPLGSFAYDARVWFRFLSFLIATALVVKAVVALAIPERFYATRRRQYASDSKPRELWVPPAIVLLVTSAAWYATIFHYRPWGWIVTGALTLLCCASLHHLLRWQRHRARMMSIVSSPRVLLVDYALLVLAAGFAALGFWVY